MENELLVQFERGIPSSRCLQIFEDLGLELKEEILPQQIVVAKIQGGGSPSSVMDRLRGYPEIAHVEPNTETELFLEDLPSRWRKGGDSK